MKSQIIGRRLLNSISKNFLLVAGTTVSAVFAVWLMSVFIYEPEYIAASQVFVEPSTSEIMRGEPSPISDYQTLEAYQVLARSPAVLSQVIEHTGSAYSIAELQNRITIDQQDNSRVLNIVVSASDKKEAAEIANAIAYTFQEEVKQLLKVDNVSVILKAGVSIDSTEDKGSLSVLLIVAAVVGLVAGVILSIMVELALLIRRRTNLVRRKNAQLQTVFK